MKSLAILVLAAACNARDQGTPAVAVQPPGAPAADVPRPDQVIGANIVPRTYDLPAGRSDELRRIFAGNAFSYPISVVSAAGAQTQFVNPRPVFTNDNHFVIALPAQYHTGLEQMLQTMRASPAAKPAPRLELAYWVVEAAAAADADVAPDLAEVAPTLKKLPGLGKRRFKSLDHVAARVVEASEAKVTGRLLHVDHKIASGPEGLSLEVSLSVEGVWDKGGPHVETTLQLEPDKAVVLGDSAQAASSDGAANLLLYVVRARRVD